MQGYILTYALMRYFSTVMWAAAECRSEPGQDIEQMSTRSWPVLMLLTILKKQEQLAHNGARVTRVTRHLQRVTGEDTTILRMP